MVCTLPGVARDVVESLGGGIRCTGGLGVGNLIIAVVVDAVVVVVSVVELIVVVVLVVVEEVVEGGVLTETTISSRS